MRHAGPNWESENTAHTLSKPCFISHEMFGRMTTVGYCFSQMESDLIGARLIWAERKRRWREGGWGEGGKGVEGDANIAKDSIFLFMLTGKQVARKWHRESAAITPNTYLFESANCHIPMNSISLHTHPKPQVYHLSSWFYYTPSVYPVHFKLMCHTFIHHLNSPLNAVTYNETLHSSRNVSWLMGTVFIKMIIYYSSSCTSDCTVVQQRRQFSFLHLLIGSWCAVSLRICVWPRSEQNRIDLKSNRLWISPWQPPP